MAVDIFLKLDGIKGESQDVGHKDEIDVVSYHWGIVNARGPARSQEITVVKLVDLASPSLFDACCSGDVIKEAQIGVAKAGARDKGEIFYKVVLEEVLVTGVKSAGGTSDAHPMEEMSLNYGKIELEYREQNPDGRLGAWKKSSCSPRGPRGSFP